MRLKRGYIKPPFERRPQLHWLGMTSSLFIKVLTTPLPPFFLSDGEGMVEWVRRVRRSSVRTSPMSWHSFSLPLSHTHAAKRRSPPSFCPPSAVQTTPITELFPPRRKNPLRERVQ